MLIDKQNPNILSLAGEFVECSFDRSGFGLGVDDEEVLLGVWVVGYVLFCCC